MGSAARALGIDPLRALGVALACLALAAASLAAAEPILIAHRGGAGELPENSLAAFRRALALGVWIELDVRSTRDGELIAIHDARLERTTTGAGRVARRDFAEIRALRLRELSRPHAPTEIVPTLAEVLALRAPGLGVLIDVKEQEREAAERVARAVRAARGDLEIAVGTRTRSQAGDFARLLPGVARVAFPRRSAELADFGTAGVEMLRVHSGWLLRDPSLAAKVRVLDAKLLLALEPRDAPRLEELLRSAPDAVLCDDPAAVKLQLAARRSGARERGALKPPAATASAP